MADSGKGTSGERRIALLTETYRGNLARYREIERLAREERRRLREGRPVAEVNEVLRAKRDILREIRAEEERVTGAREWWKKARRSLPPGSGRELLSLLDAISRTIEGTVALEAECRALLEGTLLWGGAPPATRGSGAALAAAAAYGRGPAVEGGRP